MTLEDNIRAFMLDPDRRVMLTVNGIQKVAGIPEGNLAKFLAGKRAKLPAVQTQRLVDKLKLIGFGVVENGPGQPAASGKDWGNTLPLFDESRTLTQAEFNAQYEQTPKDSGKEPELIQSIAEAEESFKASQVVAAPAPTEMSSLARLYEDRDNMSTVDFHQERQAILDDEEKADRWAWVTMPAEVTGREISQLVASYKKRKMKVALFVQLRVIAPLIENTNTWTCFLELTDEKGKLYKDYKRKASPAFCKSVFGNKAWKESHMGGVSFYTKPVGNPVIEPIVKVKPVKPASKPASKPKSALLIDLLSDD